MFVMVNRRLNLSTKAIVQLSLIIEFQRLLEVVAVKVRVGYKQD